MAREEGEKPPESQAIIMGMITFAREGNYKRFYNDLKEISKVNHKPAWFMFLDTAVSVLLFGAGLQDYLNYKFYEKSFRERRTYVTIGYMDKVYRTLAKLEYSPFISNKVSFHKNYGKYTKREYFSPEDTFENFEKFLSRHDEFVMKPQIGLGGSNIVKVKTSEIEDRQAFYQEIREKKACVEELIVQDETWGALSPNSVNTLRVMTGAVNGRSWLLFAAARIGSGKTLADNFHQGGKGVLVDLETGRLVGNGIDKKLNESPTSITGIPFDGFQIPYWEEIKKMVLEAALVNDKINIIGWDVAISKDGPLLIEGNRGPGWDLVQVLLKKGTKYMLEDLMEEVKKAEQ